MMQRNLESVGLCINTSTWAMKHLIHLFIHFGGVKVLKA